jgi:hypothetical protein
MIKRRDIVLSASAATLSGLVTAAPVSIDHSGKVYPVDQGSADLCWLASAAMLMSAARGVPVTMPQLAGELGGMWKSMYDAKSPITADRVEPFAKTLKVRTDGLKSMTPDAWAKRLASGPVLLLGYTPQARMGHAVVLVGLTGDTTDFKGMTAKVVDPNGGTKSTTSFPTLIKFYEGAASAGVPQLMFV